MSIQLVTLWSLSEKEESYIAIFFGLHYIIKEIFLSFFAIDCFVYSLYFQKLKTSVKNNNVNPVWNEDLTLTVSDPIEPLKLVSIY